MVRAPGIAHVLESAIEQVEPQPDTTDAEAVASSLARVLAVVATTNYSLAQLPSGMGVSDDVTLLLERWVKELHQALTTIVNACEGATFTIGVSTPLAVTASVTVPRQPQTSDAL